MPYVRGSLRKSKERKTDMKERVFCDLEGLAGVKSVHTLLRKPMRCR